MRVTALEKKFRERFDPVRARFVTVGAGAKGRGENETPGGELPPGVVRWTANRRACGRDYFNAVLKNLSIAAQLFESALASYFSASIP